MKGGALIPSYKQERRAYYRRLLQSFSRPHFEQWNDRLAPRLAKLLARVPEKRFVAVYSARPKEAGLGSLLRSPYKFCFPRVLGDDGRMEFRWVRKAAEPKEFREGPFGILEPGPDHPVVAREEIAACFVPLLAFDENGRRLGNGKGFYDRFLDGYEGLRIGVGFEWQFSVTPLPHERHDQRLDLVVTECGVRDFRKAL